MAAARDYVASEAAEAKRLLRALPEGSVRTALESFADVVADRSS
jgi:heptaprenyl diphosphate synthase